MKFAGSFFFSHGNSVFMTKTCAKTVRIYRNTSEKSFSRTRKVPAISQPLHMVPVWQDYACAFGLPPNFPLSDYLAIQILCIVEPNAHFSHQFRLTHPTALTFFFLLSPPKSKSHICFETPVPRLIHPIFSILIPFLMSASFAIPMIFRSFLQQKFLF